jgi:hypothetical protein
MGTTTRDGLRYPGLNDPPNGPQAFQLLAEDVESELHKAWTCTDGTRPTLVSGDAGFMIHVTDLGTLEVWTGSAWVVRSGGGGGGGTPTAGVDGQWRASSSQSIPSGTDTVVAFGTVEVSSAIVTRASNGSGHQFTLTEAGIWATTVTVRFPAGDAGSRFIELQNSAGTARHVADGRPVGEAEASTCHFSVTKRYAANSIIRVIAAQNSGSSMSLAYQGSSIVDGFVRINITKLTA